MAVVVQAASCISLAYCVALGVARHGTREDYGLQDSIGEVVLASLPALGAVLAPYPPVLALAPVAALAICWRNYRKYVYGRPFKPVDLTGKVYVITGDTIQLFKGTSSNIHRKQYRNRFRNCKGTSKDECKCRVSLSQC